MRRLMGSLVGGGKNVLVSRRVGRCWRWRDLAGRWRLKTTRIAMFVVPPFAFSFRKETAIKGNENAGVLFWTNQLETSNPKSIPKSIEVSLTQSLTLT